MKKYIVGILLLFVSLSFGQSVNNYKYALVPAKFDFLREPDQYQLNSLTKFLMEKEGFVTYIESDELPEDFITNNCNKIFVDVESSGGFLGMKLKVILKDCKKNVLFTSEIGKSKIKDYKKGYQEALRNAFKSFYSLHYVYAPLETETNTSKVANKTAQNATSSVVPVAAVATTTAATATDIKPTTAEVSNAATENLFAQPIANGYQIIDSTPKVIYKIHKTSNQTIYIANKGNLQGVFISKDNQWFFEYYLNEKLVSEKVEVKL